MRKYYDTIELTSGYKNFIFYETFATNFDWKNYVNLYLRYFSMMKRHRICSLNNGSANKALKKKTTETNNSNNNEYKFVIIEYDRIDRNTIDSFVLMYFSF